LATDVTYRHYTSGDFNDEFIGGANANAKFEILGDKFVWVADDIYGQTAVNAFALDTPGNRQSTNFFSTGPQFNFPLGERTRAYVHGTWSSATYEKLLIDNTRTTGTVGLERQASATTKLRLQATASRVKFDDAAVNSPFDVQDYSIGMNRKGARTKLDAEIGITVLHDAGQSNSAALVRVTFERQMSPNSVLTLAAGREYSDSAQFFRLEGLDLGPGQFLGNPIVAADPLKSTYANATLVHTGSRTTMRVTADMRRERRDVNTFLDVNRGGIAVAVDYRISALFDGGIFGRFRRDTFVESDGATRESGFGANLGWRIGSRVRASFLYEHTRGREIEALANVDENRMTLSFAYAVKY
ncbi:MAG: hypothetical protein ACRET4_05150, partial [Steroidobacteraceae bacterium]